MAGKSQNDVVQRLRQLPATPGTISPATFEEEGDRTASTAGERSEIASLKAPAVLAVRGGQRFQVALPAYEKFSSDGTAGNTETFALSNSVMDTPNTADVVVWIGGTYYGAPDAVDYAANTIDVIDDGTNSNVHVYFISDEPADLEVQKVTTNENGNQGLYGENLRLVHETNQSEQPETPDVARTPLNPVVPTDFTVEVYLEAPYTFRWTDADGDGTRPTNLLFSFPVNRGKGHVAGLADAVAQDMSRE